MGVLFRYLSIQKYNSAIHNNNNNNNNGISQQHFHRVAVHLLESELLVHPIKNRPSAPGRFPYSVSRSAVSSSKSPVLGLVEVGRLGWLLNVPTQGRRIAPYYLRYNLRQTFIRQQQQQQQQQQLNRQFPSFLCLCFKASPSAKPFIWKLVLFTRKLWFIYMWTKLISISKFSH